MTKRSIDFIVKGCFTLLLAITWLTSFAAIGITHPQPLPPEQAFGFSTVVSKSDEVLVQWHVAPGYYLYANKIHIKVIEPTIKADVRFPKPQKKLDGPHHKQYEVYAGNIVIPVVLQGNAETVKLRIDYQGCSEYGFCYPPVERSLTLNLITTTAQLPPPFQPADASWMSLLTDQNGIQTQLQSQHVWVILLIFFGLGLLLALTPCVLPMIPILTSIIVGHKTKSSKKAFLLSLAYVLGTSITYALAGVFAAAMGGSLQVWLQKPSVIICVSLLFGLLALSLFGFYELRLPSSLQNRLTRLSNQQKTGSFLGVFLMGGISALIVSPCVTAPLVGVLMYIGETGNMLLGASALFLLGIGMGVPLIIIGTSAGKWLPKSGPWMEAVKGIFGLLMIGMAIWLLARVLPEMLMSILWGIFLLGIGAFFVLSLPRYIGRQYINRGLGFLFGLSGMLLMININTNILSPTALSSLQDKVIQKEGGFTVIHNVADLQKQLSLAQAANRPVLLDFYADWCESCISMDKKVFDMPAVQKGLSNYVLLRADLSENSSDDEQLLKYFNIIAPPTVLFFDAKGQEMNSKRIVGEVNENEFMSRLQALPAACTKTLC